jgi:hypothetical protein
MVVMLLIHSMQGYVELGTDSWVSKITGAILASPQKGCSLSFTFRDGCLRCGFSPARSSIKFLLWA